MGQALGGGRTARYERRDSFYRRAKSEGYRSRAAYKLRDLLRRAPALRKGAAVVDLGCAPGAWLQVLAERVGPKGRVVGVDLEPVPELGAPVALLELDITVADAPERVERALGCPAHAVLSDAAPKLTGIADVDRAAGEELCMAALRVAERVLDPRGYLVVKGFPGPESDRFRALLRERFGRVRELRPEGKRATSREFYWLAEPRKARS